MDRLTAVLRFLALAIALAGLACLYLIHRPTDLASARYALSTLAPTSSLWVLLSAAVALVAGLGARAAERLPPIALWRRPRRVTEPSIDLEGSALRSPVPHLDAGAVARLGRHLGRQPDVPAFIDELLGAAAGAGASDVHIRPAGAGTHVAWRVGGELAEVVAVAKEHHDDIARRIKILASLVPYQTDLPQDGRFRFETPSGAVDVRTSVLPTRHGEKVVLRLARAGHGLLALEDLGMPQALLERYVELLARPQGLIVLTGPTGCGKTTTLYASLAHIQKTRGEVTSIASIEDPVEIDLPFLAQTQVDRATGLTFSESLRSALRQDPDVLMIGEIRDRETAKIAVEAGLTGHLILTTLHAESSAGVFNRLIDFGIEPFLVSSSVLAALSQRLGRRLCPECRRSSPAEARSVRRLTKSGINRTAAEGLSYFTAPGCQACAKTGFAGRAAVFELLEVTPALGELVTRKVSTRKIERAAVAEGMTPLVKAAVLEAVAGSLDLEEALRIAA